MSETLTKQRSYLVEFVPEEETDYAVLHALPSTDKYITTNDNAYIGHRIYQLHGGAPIYYTIRRLCVYFDTSSIPATATIISATLKIQFRSVDTNVAFDIVFQNGQPDYPHNTVEEEDYYYDNYSDDEAVINTDDIVTIAYNELDLNTDWVTKAGETKIMIRGSHEIAAVAPTPGPNTNQWVSCGANKAGRRPTLVVEYSLVVPDYPLAPILFPARPRKGMEDLKHDCINFEESISDICLVFNNNNRVIRLYLQEVYGDTTYAESSNLRDILPSQQLIKLHGKDLDYNAIIENFVSNISDMFILINENNTLMKQWLGDYEPDEADHDFVNVEMRPIVVGEDLSKAMDDLFKGIEDNVTVLNTNIEMLIERF